jgi:antitoxin HigA-1
MRQFNPPHPGRVLQDFLHGRTISDAARHLKINRVTLSRILHGAANITPDLAVRLSAALGTSEELWTGMQADFDLWHARKRMPKIKAFPPIPASSSRAMAGTHA